MTGIENKKLPLTSWLTEIIYRANEEMLVGRFSRTINMRSPKSSNKGAISIMTSVHTVSVPKVFAGRWIS